MKYLFILIILAMLAFCIFTFPIFGIEADKVYLVCDNSEIADYHLENSIKWKTEEYFVYKLDKKDYYKARFIPQGKIIKEYIFEETNSFKRNPILRCVSSGGQSVIGIPYVID